MRETRSSRPVAGTRPRRAAFAHVAKPRGGVSWRSGGTGVTTRRSFAPRGTRGARSVKRIGPPSPRRYAYFFPASSRRTSSAAGAIRFFLAGEREPHVERGGDRSRPRQRRARNSHVQIGSRAAEPQASTRFVERQRALPCP